MKTIKFFLCVIFIAGSLARRDVATSEPATQPLTKTVGIDIVKNTVNADVTNAIIKKKAVATVGPDMVTAIDLRFGRAMLFASKDRLTPAQLVPLEAAAPPINPASDASLNKRVEGIA